MLSVLTPEKAKRIIELSGKPLNPEIVKLKEEIAGETRVLELRASAGIPVSEGDILRVAILKTELDLMYAEFLEGDSKVSGA